MTVMTAMPLSNANVYWTRTADPDPRNPRPCKPLRIYLQTAPFPDNPLCFCMLTLQQDLSEKWTLIREIGYQGSSGQIKSEHFTSHEAAEHALEIARDQQLKCGYRVTFTSGHPPP